MTAMMRLLGAALGIATLVSCAALQPVAGVEPGSPMPSGAPASKPAAAAPVDTSQVPVPRAAVPVGTTSSGGTIRSTATTAAVVDSGPSVEATRVLDSIPEPLPASERVPAPAGAVAGGAGITAMAPEAAYDTLRTGTTMGEDGVPVPSPTQPLGERPGAAGAAGAAAGATAAAMPSDSLLAALAAGARDSTASAPAAPDTCWRVQFAAPDSKSRGDAVRAAAESQLLVSVVVEVEKKLYKVRTRECLTRDVADRLAARAKSAGFAGAFRFQGKKP
jgi:SPOR domain